MKFSHPDKQEGKRFVPVNSEPLTSHFSLLDELVKEYSLNAECVWNLDESGGTPGRDADSSNRHRRFLPRNSVTDVHLAEFSFTKRITLMLCVSAAGSIAPTLFVYHRKKFLIVKY